jgi:hypothetical protein
MKKVLLGLVIAVMMTGSGYADIFLNYERIPLHEKKELNEFCFDAMRKGQKLEINVNNSTYLYDNSIVNIQNISSASSTLYCHIRNKFL